ncbi:hypothetical protein A2W24_05510 [Microgenomates group bacterium RBG_16_45_19]|nr:MAG: hypothetical protein A2W24_05510 [Microgenomates group bacterium RBG_16_45_19]
MEEQKKKLVLIDGHAMLYRAWFAFPQTLTKRDGTLVNAVYGFTRILLTVLEELEPTHLAVSFDVGRTFRHEVFPAYKAHREKMPEELKAQEPLTFGLVETLNVPVFTKATYEADDVIGTLARQAAAVEMEAIIVTGDKDTLQLVDDGSVDSAGSLQAGSGPVRVYLPARVNRPAVIYDEAEVKRDLGVTPKQVPDYKGLAGDASDNIPGIRGIGKVTAVKLLTAYTNLEGVYEHVDELAGSVKQKIVSGRDSAFESRTLATIVTKVPIKLDLKAAEVKAYDKQKAVNLFTELEFTSLISKLPADAFEQSVQEALF